MTECSMCGDCCENVRINHSQGQLTAKLADPYFAGVLRRDVEFMLRNMPTTGNVDDGREVRSCNMFDSESRLCTAHDSRPLMCKGYPWYRGKPNRAERLSPRCSFNADVRTMLPIVEVRHGSSHDGKV